MRICNRMPSTRSFIREQITDVYRSFVIPRFNCHKQDPAKEFHLFRKTISLAIVQVFSRPARVCQSLTFAILFATDVKK